MKARTLVGLLPLCACTVIEESTLAHLPAFMERANWFGQRHPDLVEEIHRPGLPGYKNRHLFSMVSERRLRRLLSKMLDPNEFLSDYGIRSLSRFHLDHPYVFHRAGQDYGVDYQPAESTTGAFGGNSNWRGPIWMPTNVMLIRALLQLYRYYGDAFTIECPTGSGQQKNLFEVAKEIGTRLSRIFLKDSAGCRAVYGATTKFQTDPYWRDHLLFYEYFHGDNGAGIGASHQTGWTGLIASILHVFAVVDAKNFLEGDFMSLIAACHRDPVPMKRAS